MKIRLIYSTIAISFIIALHTITEIKIQTVAIINLLSLITLSYGTYRIQQKLFTPFLIIATCLYLFHSGHLWLCLLHGNPNDTIQLFEYGTNINQIITIYKTISTLLILFFIVGICVIKRVHLKQDNTKLEVSSVMHFVVLIVYVISMFFETKRAISVSTLGYGGGYHYESTFAIMIADYTNMILIVMIYAYRENKRIMRRYAGLMLFRCFFIMFLVGNRGISVIYLLIATFMISNYTYMANNKKAQKRLFASLFIFLLLAMPLISSTRGDKDLSTAKDQYVVATNPAEAFVEEFGGTALTAFLATDYINENGDFNGLQIFMTTLTIFPMSTFFFGSHIQHYISIGALLNDYNTIQGLGGSMIAQLILNFGESAWLYVSICLISLLICWVSNNLMTKPLSFYGTIIMLGLFSGLLLNVRDEWYSTMSQLKISCYLTLLIYVCNSSGFKLIKISKK